MRLKFTTALFLIVFNAASAQHSKVDSLKDLIKNDKADTGKIIHLNKLAWEIKFRNADSALALCKQALKIAENSIQYAAEGTDNWTEAKMGTGNTSHQMGIFYSMDGDYAPSLQSYKKALDIWNELEQINKTDRSKPDSVLAKIKHKILKHKTATIGNIGLAYYYAGDYPKALDNYLEALKIAEELDNKSGIISDYGGIALVYHSLKDHTKALDYYFKAIKLAEEMKDISAVGLNEGNIGTVYEDQKRFPEALKMYEKALKISEETGSKNLIASWTGNIANVYGEQKNYDKALEMYFKALKMRKELGAKSLIASTLGNIGSVYVRTKKYPEAEKYLLRSLKMVDSLQLLNYKVDLELSASDLYAQMGRNDKALAHYKEAMSAKDSLFNRDKSKEITRKEMNYDFEKREAATKAEQEKKDAVAAADSAKQKIFMVLISSVLFLVLVFALFIFRSLRITRVQKRLIESKNMETEMQKMIIEEKNKDILDSIHYAKRIQESLLPTEKYIERNLKRLKRS